MAQWSAAPLTTELEGSAIEARLHAIYGAVGILGLVLGCSAGCWICGSRGVVDTVSLGVLAGLVLSGGALVLGPSTEAVGELGLAISACVWTVLRVPELCT